MSSPNPNLNPNRPMNVDTTAPFSVLDCSNASTIQPKTVRDLWREIVVGGSSDIKDCKKEPIALGDFIAAENNGVEEIAVAIKLELEAEADEEAVMETGNVGNENDVGGEVEVSEVVPVWGEGRKKRSRVLMRREIVVRSPAHMQMLERDLEPVSEDGSEGLHYSEDEEVHCSEDEEQSFEKRPGRVVIGRDSKGKFVGITSYSPQASNTPNLGRKKRGRDNSWLLKKPAPGGPEIIDVIPSFGGHRAFKMYTDPTADKGVMTGHNRWRGLHELKKWELDVESINLIRGSGLGHLIDTVCEHLDMPLLTAFIERWQPDTNTFMLPFGEMSILLHDVEEILQISSSGRICTGIAEMLKHPVTCAAKFFGKSVNHLRKPYSEKKKAPMVAGKGILVSAIESRVMSSSSVEIEVQGYLMCLLGQTLFVDKTGDRVMATIYSLLMDVDDISGYAWGAGALAHLYRTLGKASRANCMQVGGCLTLLQIWIYEHFPCFRPRSDMDVVFSTNTPRACCWVTHKEKSVPHMLRQHRRTLDSLTPEMVTWLPYGDAPAKKHPMSLFSGFIRFMDIVEPYRPIRCLRQFGYCQVIPPPMPTPDVCHRPADSMSYSVKYGRSADDNWMDSDAHTLDLAKRFTRAVPSYAIEGTYDEWYKRHSHPRIFNTSFQSLQVHTNRGITDIEFRQRMVTIFGNIYNLGEEEQMTHMARILKESKPLILSYLSTDIIVRGSDRGGGKCVRGSSEDRVRNEGGKGESGIDEGDRRGGGKGNSVNVMLTTNSNKRRAI